MAMRYFALLLLLPAPLFGENWAGWRGPGSRGISSEEQLPTRWSKTENVLWKAPLFGAGVSQPIVWGDHVFVTSSDDRDNRRQHLLCYHRKDGRLLWHNRYFGSAVSEGQYAPGGMAVSTPTADGERVYALFGTGDLVCVDFEGSPVWIRSLAQEYGKFSNRWGMASSPLLVGNALLVQVDHFGESYLLNIDRKTGANRWRTKRETAVNWTSPVAVEIQGKTQIITAGTKRVQAYDLETGKELWSFRGLHEQCIPTPLVCDNRLYLVEGEGHHTVALRLDDAQGDRTTSHLLWREKTTGAQIPSPLCAKGLYYYVEDQGFAACRDAATGKLIWRERLQGKYSASPVAGAGKLYCTSQAGVVTVLALGEEYRFLARNDVGEMIVASPALSQGCVFLRGEKHLYCIGEK